MQLSELNLNRNLFKNESDPVTDGNPETMSSTNGTYTPQNSTPGDTSGKKEANQVVTATVITDCILKTSSMPARVQISDNDIYFYQDTVGGTSPVTGDTATIQWLRAKDNTQGFVMVERASVNDPLDNVWSFYANPPIGGKHNYIFIGRDGDKANAFRNVGQITMAVDYKTADSPVPGTSHGTFQVEVSKNSVEADTYVAISAGDTREIITGGTSGISVLMIARGGGYAGIAYENNVALYMHSLTEVTWAANFVPEANNSYDLGSSSNKVRTVYVGTNADIDGRLRVGNVNDAGPMTSTNGRVREIVFNQADSKFYGCIASGSPATWAALN